MRTGVAPKRIATGIFLSRFFLRALSWFLTSKEKQQSNPYFFLRKEVIQPHLPIRLPCYDFTPVTGPAFGGCFPLLGTISSYSLPGRILFGCKIHSLPFRILPRGFRSCLPGVSSPTSGISDSHGVTGGVYKTRERIHRDILIRDY